MKTAIVIGASQGIGAGIIQVFLEFRAAFGSLRLERSYK
jgi:NAD(P)-dependent dehydrogenase (short-subunit alcohol dehydrogenase family)